MKNTIDKKLAAYDLELAKLKRISQRIRTHNDNNRKLRSNMVGAPAPSGGDPVAPPQPEGANIDAAGSTQSHERIVALAAEMQIRIAVAAIDAVFGDPRSLNELSFDYLKGVLK
jgi:hypothetical protein